MYVIKDLKNRRGLPYYHMAADYYFLTAKRFDEPLFYTYTNEPSVIIGRNQNPVEEIDLDFAKKLGVKVCRRISGGGAVYHDNGNISFSIIDDYDRTKTFEHFSRYAIDALRELGVEARFHGRNDLLIGDQKVSGAAQSIERGKIIHHATLLYDVNLETLGKVLTPHELKVKSHATPSNRSRVTLIRQHIPNSLSPMAFCAAFLEVFLEREDAKVYEMTTEDQNAIDRLVDERFGTWDWNFGKNVAYSYEKKAKFPGGLVTLGLDASENRIDKLSLTGDFLAKLDIAPLTNALVGKRLVESEIRAALAGLDLPMYLGTVTVEELLSLFPLT